MIDRNNILKIGKFHKTHALKGELNAILDIEPEFIENGNALIVDMDGILTPFYPESLRPKSSTSFLVKLTGINSEDEAKRFVNQTIYALKSQIANFLEMDEEHLSDEEELMGYQLINFEDNEPLGEITGIDSTTSNLLLIVTTPTGDEILVPAAEEFVKYIDEENKRLCMNLPNGLLNLN